jgi:tetratricopeptide (TPR) repeat protein
MVSFAQRNDDLANLKKQLVTAKDSNRIQILNEIGWFYCYQSVYDSAAICFTEVLDIARKKNIPRSISAAYGGLAVVQEKLNHYEKALELLYKSLEISEKNNFHRNSRSSYVNIGNIFTDLKRYERAIENFSKALAISVKTKDSLGIAGSYHLLGEAYYNLGDTPNARKYNAAALQLCYSIRDGKDWKHTDSLSLAALGRRALHMKGTLCKDSKDFDEALVIFRQLAAEADSFSGKREKIIYLLMIASVYTDAKQYDNSLKPLQQAFTLLKNDSIAYLYKDAYQIQATGYAGLAMYEKAYESHKLFKTLSDSLLTKDNLVASTQIQANYEAEKKNLQIDTLDKQKKSQRVVTGLAIGASIIALGFLGFAYRSKRLQKKLFTEKELLLRKEKEIEKNELQKKMNELEQMALRAQMNPHFIFNSINSVQHFVMRQDVEGVNRYLSLFAHLVRQTLHNSGKELISLDEEVKYLDTYLSLEKMKSNSQFNYSISVSDDIDRSATFIPGMILQPFVENCIRHGVAHKEKNDGQIDIVVSKNGYLVCMVEDNGAGRQQPGVVKPLTAEEYQSKGMSITMKRIDTINKIYDADISTRVEDIANESGLVTGTRVVVQFPLGLE